MEQDYPPHLKSVSELPWRALHTGTVVHQKVITKQHHMCPEGPHLPEQAKFEDGENMKR